MSFSKLSPSNPERWLGCPAARPAWDAEPEYLGAPIAMIMLRKGADLGDIRIQHYGRKVRVASFLPGICMSFPGDSPKTDPERDAWHDVDDRVGAEQTFDHYIRDARDAGWTEYTPAR